MPTNILKYKKHVLQHIFNSYEDIKIKKKGTPTN